MCDLLKAVKWSAFLGAASQVIGCIQNNNVSTLISLLLYYNKVLSEVTAVVACSIPFSKSVSMRSAAMHSGTSLQTFRFGVPSMSMLCFTPVTGKPVE